MNTTDTASDVSELLRGYTPAGHDGDGELWSYITGVRGVNRIRVYERTAGGSLYYEWYDQNGRHQKTLADVTGQPVTDRMLARYLADKMAEGQARKRNAESARRFLGMPKHHTLRELLDRYDADHPDWSDSHQKNQRVNRRFWLRHLGGDTILTDVTPAKAEQAIRDEDKVNDRFGSRTREMRLRYLMDAYNYAVENLKWIEARDDLRGLKSTLRKLGSEKNLRAYKEEEVKVLLPAAEEVDLRVAAFAYIAWATGRRPKAIRALRTEHYDVEHTPEGEYGVLTFPHETDKVSKAGRAYLYGRPKAVVEKLLAQPAVQGSGWLFPTGSLDDPTVSGRISDEWLRQRWHEVEEAVGVPHVPRRSFYGLKRRFITAALRQDPRAARYQSGVTEATMRQVYEQDDAEPKRALAQHMDSLTRDVQVEPVRVPDAYGTSNVEG